jgi:hypothetical protein
VNYTIEWKNESESGGDYTEFTFYVIEDLEACVKFEVFVSVVCEDSNSSDTASINVTVTTLTDGKWHVMYRFMACTYTNSYS